MSRVPHLSRRLTLEGRTSVPDGAGGFEQSWSSLGVLWAQVVTRSGREARGNNGPVATVGYKITVRAAPVGSPARPRPEQRFRDGNRIFAIHAVTEDDAAGLYLLCYAVEEVQA